MIESRPPKSVGIMSLLDEECMFPKVGCQLHHSVWLMSEKCHSCSLSEARLQKKPDSVNSCCTCLHAFDRLVQRAHSGHACWCLPAFLGWTAQLQLLAFCACTKMTTQGLHTLLLPAYMVLCTILSARVTLYDSGQPLRPHVF